MLASLFRRFAARKSESVEEVSTVPDEVMASISVASIVIRQGGDSPTDRILVQLGVGGAAFWHDSATDAKRLQDAFGLNKSQGERAARYLANRIHNHVRKLEAAAQPNGRAWKAWKSPRAPIFSE